MPPLPTSPMSALSRPPAGVRSRSISPENFTGAKGGGGRSTDGVAMDCARDLGVGWKVNPLVKIAAGETRVLADIDGAGAIKQIWMTPTGHWRFAILRIYWDDQETPSVECPVGDFFAMHWGEFAPLSSLAVCVNPGSAFNCYWEMPFRTRCRITMENIGTDDPAAPHMVLYYQINYEEHDAPADDAAYFHAQFRRTNPLPDGEVYTILDGVSGRGVYAGTSMGWGSNSKGWWGEGEVKFYLDGDGEFPTICGTGTEDYFCGSYNFENQATKQYQEYSTPYAGLHQVIRPDGVYKSQQRFGMYRWHVTDPVHFAADLRVTCQALGWRSGHRYLPLKDDLCSTAFWYQTLPTTPFPPLPGKDALEVT